MKDTPQIKAIMKAIDEGKCKNLYAASNKVKSLKKQQATNIKKRNWYNYLSQ